jgi:hypothetical protein
MRAGLARLMQTNSYGPSQPLKGNSSIPHTRVSKGNGTIESGDKR